MGTYAKANVKTNLVFEVCSSHAAKQL